MTKIRKRKYGKDMKKTCLLFTILGFAAGLAFPQPLFKPEIKRIAVFKNGYVFTYREGEKSTLGGWAYTTNIPIGVMGTVWGYSGTPNTKVQQLLATETAMPDTEETARVADLFEFLKANEGSSLHFESLDNKSYEGVY